MTPNKSQSLYIHIPFCAHICSYCDFTKLFYFEKYEKPYLDALEKEILSYHIDIVNTVYIGGGTPTSLSDIGFERILKLASSYLDSNYEFSVEANVENLTVSKLELMKKYGVNRLSIGVESTSNKLLKEIGRNHSFEDAKNAVKMAKNIGFDNINIDLIFGFKHQTMKMLREDLKNFLELDIDHISIYSLIIEPGSILFSKGEKEPSEAKSRRFYNEILKTLRANGYERYEISNYARNKKYSRHNITYWRDKEYYGCGLGASGFVNKVRYQNTKNIDEYCKFNFVNSKETVTNESNLEYYLLTNLRMEQGFSRKEFKQIFGYDFIEKYENKIRVNRIENLIYFDEDRIKLTDDGMLLMDYVIFKLL